MAEMDFYTKVQMCDTALQHEVCDVLAWGQGGGVVVRPRVFTSATLLRNSVKQVLVSFAELRFAEKRNRFFEGKHFETIILRKNGFIMLFELKTSSTPFSENV